MTAPARGEEGLGLPFDQYQRYRLVSDVLAAVRGSGERLRILDVGGRTALLRTFLPDDDVELVDVEASDAPGLVLGDGSRLPFQDRSFDAVVTFDTLEHVPPARRDDFVRECRRVARRWVVIAGPYQSPEVARAERLLREFLATKLGERHRYLEEHHEHGLPDRARVEGLLGELGGRVTSLGHGNLERWLPLMGLALYLDRDAPLRAVARDFFRFYNRVLYASDSTAPVYRHAVVAAFDGAPLPDPAAVVPPRQAPAGADVPLDHLWREVLAFDAQRDVVRAEWDRLETVLAGHRATIERLRADAAQLEAGRAELQEELLRERAEGGAARGALEHDLAEHRASLEALGAELAASAAELARLREDLARERREGELARAALAADLAAHRASLAEREDGLAAASAELERLRADLERERREGGAAREALSADLEGHRALLAARDEELAAARGHADALGAGLARERAAAAEAIEALASDLAGHRQSLAAAQAELAELRAAFEAERRAMAAVQGELAGELEAHRAVRRELESELGAHRTAQGELLAELERLHGIARSIQEDLLRTQGELATERALVAHLRGELRDRWKNLKRAFARKKFDS